MYRKKLIPANDFCINHNIEISFISSLQQNGLIEITTIENTEYIHENQLNQLEKIVRLFYDLDINLEGIETITHLIKRIGNQDAEITALKNRLGLYEAVFIYAK
jgi:hypothetical protein